MTGMRAMGIFFAVMLLFPGLSKLPEFARLEKPYTDFKIAKMESEKNYGHE